MPVILREVAGSTPAMRPPGEFSRHRALAEMSHAERVFRNVQMSWSGGDASAASPWARMFGNARKWVG